MSTHPESKKDHVGAPDLTRRQMGVGLLAMVAGAAGLTRKAQAFDAAAAGNFNAASHVLQRYGVVVTGDDSGGVDRLSFTHVHPGEIVPCVRTTIEGHSRAIYELFDADEAEVSDGDIIPCIKVASEMLEGGRLGAVEIDIDPDEEGLVVRVGTRVYELVGGELQVQRVQEDSPR